MLSSKYIRLGLLLGIAATLLWYALEQSHRSRPRRTDFAGPIQGLARVIDGDTIEIANNRIRLYGIDAPESGQTCSINHRSYRCGESATRALADLVQGHEVRCDPTGVDRYRRKIARCELADSGVRINSWLVREGFAVAYRRYSHAYISDEYIAWAARRGLWAGTFEMPWHFRHEAR
jgi:endonuclease YncB( thermonuclease family)